MQMNKPDFRYKKPEVTTSELRTPVEFYTSKISDGLHGRDVSFEKVFYTFAKVYFTGALEVFKDTGETIESATVGNVTGAFEGVPMVKLGFGAGSRWRLEHLNELGYAKKSSPRGFGVIRRFSEANREKFKYRLATKLKGEGLG